MPRIKSAKKALRQSVRRRARNQKRKTDLKSVIKNYKKLVAAHSTISGQAGKDEAKSYLSQVYKKLDKAAKVNLIEKNKAARLKSRLSKLLK